MSLTTLREERDILHSQDRGVNGHVVNLLDCARLVETVQTVGLDWLPPTVPLVRASSKPTAEAFGR